MQIKTKALVLKQRNIGENDRILTLLTSDMGIIEATARSVKSTKSALSASCQLLSYSDFCLFKGKSNYIVNSAETINNFYKLRLDVVKISLAGYFCELSSFLSPTHDNSWPVLRLLLNTLHLLEEDKKDMELLKSIFELRALAISGFMPDLVGCQSCGEYVKDSMFFLPVDGMIICSDCMSDTLEMTKISLPLPVLMAMRHIVYSSDDKVFSFALKDEPVKWLSYITEQYMLHQTDAHFNSLEMYKTLKI